MSSLAYEAFGLYVQDQRKAFNVPQDVPSPLGLTFDKWIKTSAVVQEYLSLAQKQRDNRPKTTKQLNDEHSLRLRLSQRLSKTDSQTEGSQNASGDPKRKANT